MRYTAKDRRLAIRICQIAASGGVCWDGITPSRNEYDIADALDLEHNSPAPDLAEEAWRAVRELIGPAASLRQDADAEAECLLRDGWSPGEPVVRLGGCK